MEQQLLYSYICFFTLLVSLERQLQFKMFEIVNEDFIKIYIACSAYIIGETQPHLPQQTSLLCGSLVWQEAKYPI